MHIYTYTYIHTFIYSSPFNEIESYYVCILGSCLFFIFYFLFNHGNNNSNNNVFAKFLPYAICLMNTTIFLLPKQLFDLGTMSIHLYR